jgi:DnaJ-class molecular chaperone
MECKRCNKPIHEGAAFVYGDAVFHKECGEDAKNEAEGFVKCKKCRGTGVHEYMSEGSFSWQIDGRGSPPEQRTEPCKECDGTGRIKGEYVSVTVTKEILRRK